MDKICCTCKQSKPPSEFGNNKHKKDGKQYYCKACGRDIQRRHYLSSAVRRSKIDANRSKMRDRSLSFVLDYLSSHPCVDCGEDDPLVLDFDHICPTEKKACVSQLFECSLETLRHEISKCEVRCANCHRRKTAFQFGWRRACHA